MKSMMKPNAALDREYKKIEAAREELRLTVEDQEARTDRARVRASSLIQQQESALAERNYRRELMRYFGSSYSPNRAAVTGILAYLATKP